MTTVSALNEIEKITQAMLTAAVREDFLQVAQLESQRRSLIAGIAPSALQAGQQPPVIQRIIECNQEITRRLEGRREDIGLLLQAFGESDIRTGE